MIQRQIFCGSASCTSGSAKLLLVLAGIFFLIANVDIAQAQRNKKLKLYVGDIVEYNDWRDRRTLGLLLSLEPKLVIESLDTNGNIVSIRPSRSNPDVKVIDSLRSKKAERPRRWQSADQKFTLEATLLSFDEESVRLKKSDGKTISIPRSKLCEKDQTYLDKSTSEQPENPFEVDESQEFPEEVMKLIVRRKALMKLQTRHQQLLRLNRRPLVGDIIKYTSKSGEIEFGIIASLESDGTIERVDDDDKIEEERADLEDVSWWYYDREVRPIMSRVWKSSTGKFTIEAKLVGLEGDLLELQKLDGTIAKVPLSKLAGTSQEYVEKVRPRFESSEESIEDQRKRYDPTLKQLLARREVLLDRLRRYQIAAKDASQIKPIKLSERSLQTLSAEQLTPENLNGQSFSIEVDIDLAPSARITEISYAKQSGLVAFTIPRRDGPPKLALVDVNASSLTTNARKDPIGEDGEVLSISPSGETILLISDDERGEQQLEVWKHLNGVLTRFATVPYESYRTPNAHLFNDASGMILDAKGALVFFDLTDRVTPTHIVTSPNGSNTGVHFQISNDQKTIFLFGSGGYKLYAIDVASKRCLGGVALGLPPESRVRYGNTAISQVNADGETATMVAGSKLSVVDLRTGNIIKENTTPTSVGRSWSNNFPVLSPNLVRSSSGSIYDLKLGVSIGSVGSSSSQSRYFSSATRIRAEIERNRNSSAKKSGGFGKIGDYEKEERSVLKIQAETLDIDQLVKFSDGLSEKDVVVFGAGKDLALDIDVGDSGSDGALETKLTSLMSAAGVNIVDESDYVMKLRFTTGEPETETFNIVQMNNPYSLIPNRYNSTKIGQRTATITPKSASAVLTFRGETLWRTGDSVRLGHPGSVDGLNKMLQKASSLTARSMTEYKYPTDLRMLLPSKKGEFNWR